MEFIRQSVLEADELEVGKMDECKNLSDFDKGQIVMARRLDQGMTCEDALWVFPGMQWLLQKGVRTHNALQPVGDGDMPMLTPGM